MTKILITSALPYVNNIPHLGNLIQVLSADVFARFCRLTGKETLYICGTDEYGTATETKALEEKITPKQLCDRYFKEHEKIYNWFNISFDKFGRTSTQKHTQITQHIFLKLNENGYINEKTIEQLYCKNCNRFLADRYIRGTCPHCNYQDARGDQCENCGKLLDPTDLIQARCEVCNKNPIIKKTKHLYINLPAILPQLNAWMQKAAKEGDWNKNAVQITQAWIRDGLMERCITRDLKWGIPVPKDGFREKVFYVWFDAPIGYISITATFTDDWAKWWKNPEQVRLFQFIGKDNIPFHTVIFPCSLLGTAEKWTLLHHMSSSEYMNYENKKFSKSKGIGIFGNDAIESGIPADVWRFYIYYNRPEKSDSMFMWKDFQEKVNSELIGNFSNLVNRTLSFIKRFFTGKIPQAKSDSEFWQKVKKLEAKITASLQRVELRTALTKILQLADLGNKRFQAQEPWRTRNEDPPAAASLMYDLAYLVRDLAILIQPFLPVTSQRILDFFGLKSISWNMLGKQQGLNQVKNVELLFKRIENEEVDILKQKYSGQKKEKQKSRITSKFTATVELKVGKIIHIEPHPGADKLYIEKVYLGDEERQIISGLVPYYKEDELLDKNVIIVTNLKAAKLRGQESKGMLLAAEDDHTVEVLFVPQAKPGDRVVLFQDTEEKLTSYSEIDIDTFFSVPITVKNKQVLIDNQPLMCKNKPITTNKVTEGKVR